MSKFWQIGITLASAALASSAGFAQQSVNAAPPAPAAPTAPRAARAAATVAQTSMPYLGVAGEDLGAERARALKVKEEHGVVVTMVSPDAPASKAGVKQGDVIVEYNGAAVQTFEQLRNLIKDSTPGKPVKLLISRNGVNQTLMASVESRRMTVISGGDWPVMSMEIPMSGMVAPAMPAMEIPRLQPMMQNPILGITGEPMGDEQQLGEYFGVKDGVLVRSVSSNSPAERAGVKAGDVVVKVEETRVGSNRELQAALRIARAKGAYPITVVRNKREMTINIAP